MIPRGQARGGGADPGLSAGTCREWPKTAKVPTHHPLFKQNCPISSLDNDLLEVETIYHPAARIRLLQQHSRMDGTTVAVDEQL